MTLERERRYNVAKKVKTYKVQYKSNDPSNPKFKNSGKSSMKVNDWIEIELNDAWPPDSTINSISFYHNTVVDGHDQKDESNPLGFWTSEKGNGLGLAGKFSCSAESNTLVKVSDIETLGEGSEIKYWFAVAGTIGSTSSTWSVDPELINKGSA